MQEDDKTDTIKCVINMTETSAELAEISEDQENKSDAATTNFDKVYDIGNEETERFHNNVEEKCNEHNVADNMEENQAPCNCCSEENILNIIASYHLILNNVVKVLCHRSPNRFWSVLFHQSVNFATVDMIVIWAGEPGEDGDFPTAITLMVPSSITLKR